MARVLVCGALGMLGQRLVEAFSADHEVTPTALTNEGGATALDIVDAAAVRAAVQACRPDWIVNAAAYTAVDRAEVEADAAFLVNAEGPASLAAAAAEAGCVLLHVGTDFVFDGRKADPYVEDDPVGPLGAYARSKAEGEERVRASGCEHVILRVSWLYGPDGGNFVRTIMDVARAGRPLRVVADQDGTPTFTRDAAEQAVRVLESGLRGVIHSSNVGVTTWHGLATEALRIAGLKVAIEPISTADWQTPAPRPANSALRNAVLERTIGNGMRPWQEALEDYVGSGG